MPAAMTAVTTCRAGETRRARVGGATRSLRARTGQAGLRRRARRCRRAVRPGRLPWRRLAALARPAPADGPRHVHAEFCPGGQYGGLALSTTVPRPGDDATGERRAHLPFGLAPRPDDDGLAFEVVVEDLRSPGGVPESPERKRVVVDTAGVNPHGARVDDRGRLAGPGHIAGPHSRGAPACAGPRGGGDVTQVGERQDGQRAQLRGWVTAGPAVSLSASSATRATTSG
jgi:hypothetical protein